MTADIEELLDRSDIIDAFTWGKMSREVKSSETSADELGHLIGGEE